MRCAYICVVGEGYLYIGRSAMKADSIFCVNSCKSCIERGVKFGERKRANLTLTHAKYYVCCSRSHLLPGSTLCYQPRNWNVLMVWGVIEILSSHNAPHHINRRFQCPPYITTKHDHGHHNSTSSLLPRSILLKAGENYLPLFLVIGLHLPRNSQ